MAGHSPLLGRSAGDAAGGEGSGVGASGQGCDVVGGRAPGLPRGRGSACPSARQRGAGWGGALGPGGSAAGHTDRVVDGAGLLSQSVPVCGSATRRWTRVCWRGVTPALSAGGGAGGDSRAPAQPASPACRARVFSVGEGAAPREGVAPSPCVTEVRFSLVPRRRSGTRPGAPPSAPSRRR